MRLEYKVGIVIALAVVGLGTWFFITRDRASDSPVASGPKAGPVAAAPSPGAARQTSPQPAPAVHQRQAQPHPVVRQEVVRTPMSVTTRPSHANSGFSIDPDRSSTPGIRSETPITGPEVSSGLAERSPSQIPAKAPTPPGKPAEPGATALVTPRPSPVVSAQPVVSPPASPAPSGSSAAPSEGAVRTHVIKQGETIQGLAIKYYGAAKYASLILAANKHLGDPRRIAVGTKVTIPPAPPAGSETPKASAGATTRPSAELRTATAEPRRQPPNTKPYQVKKGDTWRKLAAIYYGSEAEAPQLFELNKRSPNETMHTLRAGETIYVPLATSQASPPARTLMGTAPKP